MEPPKKKISGKSAKAKGRRGQNDLVDRLRAMHPHLDKDDVTGAIMGQTGADIVLSPAARKVIPYAFEVKSVAKATIFTNFDQACRHAAKSPTTATPLVVTKLDRRKEPLVTMEWSHFETLLREAGRC